MVRSTADRLSVGVLVCCRSFSYGLLVAGRYVGQTPQPWGASFLPTLRANTSRAQERVQLYYARNALFGSLKENTECQCLQLLTLTL